jgi:hypothetical protein
MCQLWIVYFVMSKSSFENGGILKTLLTAEAQRRKDAKTINIFSLRLSIFAVRILK